MSFFFLPQNRLSFSGTLSFALAMRCTLVLEILHRRAISSSVRCVVFLSALTVAFVSSGILFLRDML